MNNIKSLKAQSLLKEVLQEIFYGLDDGRINSLNIISVKSSKKEFACVFLDASSLDLNEQKDVLKALKNANGILHEHLKNALNWYKIPRLMFEFDNSLEQINRLERIFKEIHKKDLNAESRNKD